ncbi:MAG: hypothetical protein H0T11_04500 [Chthoniobacterales bacterium]|nr:hypothetical protein [Chthoniobacterales bacterium]
MASLALAAVLGVTWYAYQKLVNRYTSAAPVTVSIEAPNEAQFAAANQKFEQIRTAVSARRATAVEFTATDLNALIARHPSFSKLRDRIKVGMEKSVMQLDASVPLSSVPFPGLSRRWLNGTLRLGLTYDDDNFALALRSATANGLEIPVDVLQRLDATSSGSLTEWFRKWQHDDSQAEEFWEQIDSMKAIDDKLVVTTKGGEVALVW